MATAIMAVRLSVTWKLFDITFVKLKVNAWIAQGLKNYCLGTVKNISVAREASG